VRIYGDLLPFLYPRRKTMAGGDTLGL